MKKDDDAIILTKGSRYVVKSLESQDKPLETKGIFKGYTAIGSDDAICMELDDSYDDFAGKIRILPIAMLVSIDVLEQAEEEEKLDKETARYFG